MEPPPVQYARTSDGRNIAYAVTGTGPPLVFLPLGLNHIQLAWQQDGRISGWLQVLSQRFRLVQYDGRATGMSERGLDDTHCLEDLDRDLEAVMDQLGLRDAVLLGYFYSGHVAIRYALKHPERVRALVLVSCSPSIGAWPLDSLRRMAEQNWDAMLYNWVPGSATPEDRARYLAFFKETRTQADWLIAAGVFSTSNVELEASQVHTPTLVMHPRDFLWLRTEESAKLASRIPNARFQLIPGELPLGDATEGVLVIERFLQDVESEQPVVSSSPFEEPSHRLSAREVEVLSLIASGRSNQQIADALVISLNTVNRHVSNIFVKIGAANRAEAAAYAARHGLLPLP
jgi:pimeloyl-ACP methyl ester carboxylesterase/DNA-binding CsgD family transcriptional regulator